jgi:hypothetical protein
MWEFSLNVKTDKTEVAEFLFENIKKNCLYMQGIVTLHEENNMTSILVAVDDDFSQEATTVLERLITQVICTYFKFDFLEKNLKIPMHDKIGMTAFKKALLNFDRETDKFLVLKNLNLEKSLYLDSFYDFRLTSLKSKWTELVSLANENRVYLISNDAFVDLLKFLIDNIEICEDEINIVENDEGYKIFLEDGETTYDNVIFNEEGLVSSIIDLAPQKINLYCRSENSTIGLLEKIFDERINVCTEKALVKKM